MYNYFIGIVKVVIHSKNRIKFYKVVKYLVLMYVLGVGVVTVRLFIFLLWVHWGVACRIVGGGGVKIYRFEVKWYQPPT